MILSVAQLPDQIGAPKPEAQGHILLGEDGHVVAVAASVYESFGSGVASAEDEVAVVVDDDTLLTAHLAVAVPDVVLVALLVFLPVAEGVEGRPSVDVLGKHDSDPFKIDKSRSGLSRPIVSKHPHAPT